MSLLLHELRVRRGAMVGWALGLGLFLSLYTTIYRFLPAEVREMDVRALAFLNSLGIETFATFEGFILGTAFNFAPLLVGLFGVIIGVGALAGEEDEGMLELLAALPVSRVRLLLAKAAALFIAALVVMAVAGAIQAIVFTLWQIDTPVTALDLFQVAVSHWLIAFVFITFSLFIGAYLPGRGAALATATTALFVSMCIRDSSSPAPTLAGQPPADKTDGGRPGSGRRGRRHGGRQGDRAAPERKRWPAAACRRGWPVRRRRWPGRRGFGLRAASPGAGQRLSLIHI